MLPSPFSLQTHDAYRAWSEKKREGYPSTLAECMVEIKDMGSPAEAELQQIKTNIQRCNFSLYRSEKSPDRNNLMYFASLLGLHTLDRNLFARSDGLSALTVTEGEREDEFIPYTNREIHWHTDGYYNEAEKSVGGLLLHCERAAPTGGENRLVDHEMAYIHLRESGEKYVRALMEKDVMVIPEHRMGNRLIRREIATQVFSVDGGGELWMRYTQRKKNIVWKDDAIVHEAVKILNDYLASDAPEIFSGKLADGEGLICNNVLHDRSAFVDDPQRPRLLYRGRYLERVQT